MTFPVPTKCDFFFFFFLQYLGFANAGILPVFVIKPWVKNLRLLTMTRKIYMEDL